MRSKEEMLSLYALIDPREEVSWRNQIRYVGITKKSLQRRLSEHLQESKNNRKRHVYKWIRKLSKVGLIPKTIELARVSDNWWQIAECTAIKHFKDLGYRLCNHTDGGDGTLGWSPSEEYRKAAALRMKGNTYAKALKGFKRSEQNKANLSKALKGRILTEEWKRKISENHKGMLGKKMSEEAKQKIAEKNKGPKSVRHRYKLRQPKSVRWRYKLRLAQRKRAGW